MSISGDGRIRTYKNLVRVPFRHIPIKEWNVFVFQNHSFVVRFYILSVKTTNTTFAV